MQAGVAQYALDISHQSQIDKLSPISIVTFRNSWQRHRLATFMATLSKTNQGISYWAADGEVSSKVKIKGRIQICTYDRVLGLPLKAALEIIGSNNLGSDTVEKIWKVGGLRASSGLIIVKVKTDIEIGISKVFIHKDLFEIFLRGWEAAWNKVTVAPSSSKSNTKSSGKGIALERRIRVPFEIKLVKFHDYPEGEKVDSEHNVGEWNAAGKVPLKKNLRSSLDKYFRFYIASNPSPNPTPTINLKILLPRNCLLEATRVTANLTGSAGTKGFTPQAEKKVVDVPLKEMQPQGYEWNRDVKWIDNVSEFSRDNFRLGSWAWWRPNLQL